MNLDKLTEKILEITNNSDYGWIDLDSSDADRIKALLKEGLNEHIPVYAKKGDYCAVCGCTEFWNDDD